MARTLDVPAKPLWQSWTFWVNLLSIIAMLIEAVTTENLLPSPWNERALALLGFVNIALRLKTTQPVQVGNDPSATRTVTSGTPPLLLVLALIPAMLLLLAFELGLVVLRLA
ncbi:MAG TPA: hypothetical protein VD838_21155 [Anaeromyxobacteraceae bacterium]|nr:hypothetical protein [Anaeromyxobacteraceae bacterium]